MGHSVCCSRIQLFSSWCHLLCRRVAELVLGRPGEAGLRPPVTPQLLDEPHQLSRHAAILQGRCHGTQLPFVFLKRDFSKYCASALCPFTSLKMCLVYNELRGQNFSFSLFFARFLYWPVHVNILLQAHFPLGSGQG